MAKQMDATSLDGLRRDTFVASSKKSHDIYRVGSGPAVIVIHEVPGLTPLVAAFGRKVAERGMTAVMPDLFGTPGRIPSGGYLVESVLKACVSREFTVLATNKTSPITKFLRELATHEHESCGGPGVGAVGMCLTGGFALAMSVDETVVAPVLSQPGLPIPMGAKRKAALGISDDDLAKVKRRSDAGLCVMGLRFSGDPGSPGERFATLRRELGSNFIGVEIDSSKDNPWGYRKGAHSVLTEDYSDAEGSPTRQALDDVLSFLSTRLGVATTS
ncbi:MAG TPA: dienelactone hydrolase family protein [Acidimicrobiales bacterium]|nr:dienelactone hydrolase family protein [Acidimicrobiales bacterium]